MTTLPTIQNIAHNLYTEKNLEYTNKTLESVPEDNRDGFDTVMISANAICYSAKGIDLIVQEIIGLDEDRNETILDYLITAKNAEGRIVEESSTSDPEELIATIKNLMC